MHSDSKTSFPGPLLGYVQLEVSPGMFPLPKWCYAPQHHQVASGNQTLPVSPLLRLLRQLTILKAQKPQAEGTLGVRIQARLLNCLKSWWKPLTSPQEDASACILSIVIQLQNNPGHPFPHPSHQTPPWNPWNFSQFILGVPAPISATYLIVWMINESHYLLSPRSNPMPVFILVKPG